MHQHGLMKEHFILSFLYRMSLKEAQARCIIHTVAESRVHSDCINNESSLLVLGSTLHRLELLLESDTSHVSVYVVTNIPILDQCYKNY